MGDACNLVSHRMEDPGEESFPLKGLKKEMEKEKEPTLQRPSGEPGEVELAKSCEPTRRGKNQAEDGAARLYDTKLRPEAPPFTPESLIANERTRKILEMDNSCFVSIDLRPTEDRGLLEQRPPALPRINKDSKEAKDPALKPFSLTSTPHLKKVLPKAEITILEDADAVLPAPTTSSITRGTSTVPEFVGHSRVLSRNFLFSNRTQIAVLIASLVVCVVLVIHVLP